MTSELLEQLAEHLDQLDDQLASLVAAGEYLWFRPADNTFHATHEFAEPAPGDIYLFDASEAWKAQWAGDWAAAADALVESLAANLDELKRAGR